MTVSGGCFMMAASKYEMLSQPLPEDRYEQTETPRNFCPPAG